MLNSSVFQLLKCEDLFIFHEFNDRKLTIFGVPALFMTLIKSFSQFIVCTFIYS